MRKVSQTIKKTLVLYEGGVLSGYKRKNTFFLIKNNISISKTLMSGKVMEFVSFMNNLIKKNTMFGNMINLYGTCKIITYARHMKTRR